jgi:hypothetical protein
LETTWSSTARSAVRSNSAYSCTSKCPEPRHRSVSPGRATVPIGSRPSDRDDKSGSGKTVQCLHQYADQRLEPLYLVGPAEGHDQRVLDCRRGGVPAALRNPNGRTDTGVSRSRGSRSSFESILREARANEAFFGVGLKLMRHVDNYRELRVQLREPTHIYVVGEHHPTQLPKGSTLRSTPAETRPALPVLRHDAFRISRRGSGLEILRTSACTHASRFGCSPVRL